MTDQRKGGNGFGVPSFEDDFEDIVLGGVKSTESSLAQKNSASISRQKNIGSIAPTVKKTDSLQGKDKGNPVPQTPSVACVKPSHSIEGDNKPISRPAKQVPLDPHENHPTNTLSTAIPPIANNSTKDSSLKSDISESIRLTDKKTTEADGTVQIKKAEEEKKSTQGNALMAPPYITPYQGDDMNNENAEKKSSERKLGAGFGIPTASDDEIDGFVPIHTPPKDPSVISPVRDVRKGNGGFGIPQNIDEIPPADGVETIQDEIIPIEEGGDYPFRHKKAIQKKAAAEEMYEAISLQGTFITRLQKWYLSGLIILATFLGFYTITQTTNFIVQLKDCPAFVKYPLYVAIGLFALVIFFFIYKLIRSWFSLKQSPQVSLGMLSNLSKRRDLQEKCDKKTEEACKDLYEFLKGIKEDEYRKALKAMNVSEEEIDGLDSIRKNLCNRHEARLSGKGHESESEWIDSFADYYQTKLDYIAKERIKYYSYRGGLAATVSHISAMDRFIVLSAMFGLTNDLIIIYNLKPSRINSTILLSKIIINVFCAGYVQDAAESVGDITSKISSCITNNIPFASAIGEGAELTAEFTAHVVLIQRVGVAAQKILCPVIKSE